MGNGLFDGLTASRKINAGLDEVYVLSIPSFVWFKANYTSSDPRVYHTCNIVGNRQMLSIGGLNPSAANFTAADSDPDPFWEGVKVFDLTALQWTNYFNATAAPYVAPSAVLAHYAAGSRYPSTWSSKDVENLFLMPTSKSTTPFATPTSTSTSNSSTLFEPSASTSPRPGNPNRPNRTAAMVGGAVGGIAAVALVGLALYLLARNRANQTSRKREESNPAPTFKNGEPVPMGNIPEAGQGFPHELDSTQALPYELDTGQKLPHEADSRDLYELSNRTQVGSNDMH